MGWRFLMGEVPLNVGECGVSGDTTPCKVTPVILHGVASPVTAVILHRVESPKSGGRNLGARAGRKVVALRGALGLAEADAARHRALRHDALAVDRPRAHPERRPRPGHPVHLFGVEFQLSGFEFRVLGLGFRISYFVFGVRGWGLGFEGFGFRV